MSYLLLHPKDLTVLITEQMAKNKSLEDVMIAGTFTKYLLRTESNPRHEKKVFVLRTLPFSYPVPWGRGAQNTFTWQHIISDKQAVSKIEVICLKSI